MIKITARQLALLSAAEFMSHFDYNDLTGLAYRGDYEPVLEGMRFLLTAEFIFTKDGSRVVDFSFGLREIERDEKVEITGSVNEGKKLTLRLINAYLKNYNVYVCDR
ncbi:hypothetical protein [Coprobacter tertius]|uniref:Uncharacterized protein n=1 Tax=Coprobacter tertius TaxID=2944915 RepID=A0ABT1MK93_9BACT|nr:hypothetical protein [Coprobacter tertius]MCP9613040.1 hypothetical protein [Coprobacter tertius]